MLIQDVMNFGARPALTDAMSFAAQRQRLIVHNIANLDTPNYQAKDVSVPAFQSALKKALDRRAETANGTDLGEFSMPETRDFVRDARGNMQLSPRDAKANILYHDRNNRDLERSMQDLAENGLQFRFAADVLRQQGELLRAAISQRV
ncbi:MAG: flagellar basal body rod protein FlgB [Phycisphaerales bacterium]